jgi:DNA-directed RNA polymerase subunit RPC12/RpoP
MTKKEARKNRKRRRKIFLAFIMILFLALVLTASTYAWFTANRTVTVESIDVNSLTVEQLIALAQARGLKVTEKKVNSKLKIENGIATCLNCGTTFALSDVDEELLKKLHKNGLCPECQHKIDEAQKIMGLLKANNIGGERVIKNGGKKVGEQLRAIVSFAVTNNRLNEEVMELLTTREASKVLTGFNFAMFIDVTGMSKDEIKEAKLVNGRSRYLANTLVINGKSYLLSNDIYDKQLAMTKEYFIENEIVTADEINEING